MDGITQPMSMLQLETFSTFDHKTEFTKVNSVHSTQAVALLIALGKTNPFHVQHGQLLLRAHTSLKALSRIHPNYTSTKGTA